MPGVGMRGREGMGEGDEESNVQSHMKQAYFGKIWARWLSASERNADCWQRFAWHMETMIRLWTTFDKSLNQRSLSMYASILYKVPLC